jgi:hypothetical protein
MMYPDSSKGKDCAKRLVISFKFLKKRPLHRSIRVLHLRAVNIGRIRFSVAIAVPFMLPAHVSSLLMPIAAVCSDVKRQFPENRLCSHRGYIFIVSVKNNTPDAFLRNDPQEAYKWRD